MADMLVLDASAARRVGSSPTPATKLSQGGEGWLSRQIHNLENEGSNPSLATN